MIEIVVFADLVRAAGAVIIERALAGGRQAGEVDIIHLITAPGGIIDIVVKIIHIQIDLVVDVDVIGDVTLLRRGALAVADNNNKIAGNTFPAVSLALERNGYGAFKVIVGDEEQIVNFVMIEIVVFADLVRAAGAVIIERALAGGRQAGEVDIIHLITAPGGIIDIVVKIIHIQIDLVIDIRLIGHIAGGRRTVSIYLDFQCAAYIFFIGL